MGLVVDFGNLLGPALLKTCPSCVGTRRNEAMVRAGAGLCLAVHRDLASSKGTLGCARLAFEAGIPMWLIDSDDAKPVRLRAEDPRLI